MYFLLWILYFVQGAPYGFQAEFLPIILREKGSSYSYLSWMKVLLVPWLSKSLFAPIIDNHKSKKFWLLASLTGLMLSSFFGILTKEDDFLMIFIVIFLLNLFSATQDIAVDGIAISSLTAENIGVGNTIQVISYKLGSIFIGGGLLWIYLYFNWSFIYIFLFLMYGIVFLISFFKIHENLPKNQLLEIGKLGSSHNKLNFIEIFSLILDKRTIVLIFYLFFYKFGESIALSNLPLYLIDLGFSSSAVGFQSGFSSKFFSIIGSVFGGYLLRSTKLNIFSNLMFFSTLRAIPIIAQTIVVLLFTFNVSDEGYFYFCIFMLYVINFMAGVITVFSFTIMMEFSRLPLYNNYQATHYTVLATVEVGGKLFASFLGGFIMEYLGSDFSWVFTSLVALFGLFPLSMLASYSKSK